MAGQAYLLEQSFVATVALTEGTCVVADTATAGNCTYGAAATANGFVGVVTGAFNAGDVANVRTHGLIYVQAAVGGITIGADLCIGNASGQVDLLSAHAGAERVGVALEASAEANDLILMLIK